MDFEWKRRASDGDTSVLVGHRPLHRHGDPSSFSTPLALPQSPLLAMRGIAMPCQEAKRGTFKESQSLYHMAGGYPVCKVKGRETHGSLGIHG